MQVTEMEATVKQEEKRRKVATQTNAKKIVYV